MGGGKFAKTVISGSVADDVKENSIKHFTDFETVYGFIDHFEHLHFRCLQNIHEQLETVAVVGIAAWSTWARITARIATASKGVRTVTVSAKWPTNSATGGINSTGIGRTSVDGVILWTSTASAD